MQPIKDLRLPTATPTEKIYENIRANKDKGIQAYKSFQWRRNFPVAIVGGGPSLKNNLVPLSKFERIIVCGSAHDYLIDNNIIPEWCVVCDPDPIVIKYLKNKRHGVKYLIASQCDPSVYRYLDGYDVYTWHCFGDGYDMSVFGEHQQTGGGCTVGTRSLVIALDMGFDNLHLFGFDSCLTNDYKHHAYDFVDPDVETLGRIQEICLEPDGKKYRVADFMLAQMFDFQAILKMYANRLNITIHGEGLLKDLMDKAVDLVKEQENADKTKSDGVGGSPLPC